MNIKKHFLCPCCKAHVQRYEEYFPFCCKRCQTLDLARWADGSYSIPGDPIPDHDNNDEHSIH